jgi:hypothetical protein
LRQVIHGNNTLDGVYITLRMRLRCEIFRNGKAMPGKVFDVLNEVVVDRGSNPYLSKIECYEHDRLITKVNWAISCLNDTNSLSCILPSIIAQGAKPTYLGP